MIVPLQRLGFQVLERFTSQKVREKFTITNFKKKLQKRGVRAYYPVEIYIKFSQGVGNVEGTLIKSRMYLLCLPR